MITDGRFGITPSEEPDGRADRARLELANALAARFGRRNRDNTSDDAPAIITAAIPTTADNGSDPVSPIVRTVNAPHGGDIDNPKERAAAALRHRFPIRTY